MRLTLTATLTITMLALHASASAAAGATGPASPAPLQLRATAHGVELASRDVARARRSASPASASIELLDSHDVVIARVFETGLSNTVAVRGQGSTALAVEAATAAPDALAGTFALDDAVLVWKDTEGRSYSVAHVDGRDIEITAGGPAAKPAPVEVNPAPIAVAPEFALLPTEPNPFRSATTIRYVLPSAGRVQMELFDIAGRRTANLFDGVRSAGPGSLNYQQRNLAPGLYHLRMTFAPSSGEPTRRASRRILLTP